MKLSYIQDEGHGWLQVPWNVLRTFPEILPEISTCSYYTAGRDAAIFLEEDCDMGLFLEQAKKRNLKIILRDVYVEKWAGRESPLFYRWNWGLLKNYV